MKKMKNLGLTAMALVKNAPMAALFVGGLLVGSLALDPSVATAQFNEGLRGGL